MNFSHATRRTHLLKPGIMQLFNIKAKIPSVIISHFSLSPTYQHCGYTLLCHRLNFKHLFCHSRCHDTTLMFLYLNPSNFMSKIRHELDVLEFGCEHYFVNNRDFFKTLPLNSRVHGEIRLNKSTFLSFNELILLRVYITFLLIRFNFKYLCIS